MLLRCFLCFLAVFLFSKPDQATAKHTPATIQKKIIIVGDGPSAVRHSKVQVHYTGWLKDGTKFDSSYDKGRPFEFTIGTGQVIPGWDMGVEGMRVGGKRKLIIPPGLAYGSRGAGSVIPPNASLTFEIALLKVVPPKYQNIDNLQLKEMLKDGVTLIDLRRLDEWNKTGVVKGSHKITAFDKKGNFLDSFPIEFRKITQIDKPVVLICRTGNRSSEIANLLVEKAGYKKVFNVKHGIKKWIAGKNKVVPANE
jgi:rhodanese-related sulfurtransferase